MEILFMAQLEPENTLLRYGQELISTFHPPVIYVAYTDDNHARGGGDWLVYKLEDFLKIPNRAPGWYSAMGFDGDPQLTEFAFEETRYFDLNFQENPAAAWEVHMWDNSYEFLIIKRPMDFKLGPMRKIVNARVGAQPFGFESYETPPFKHVDWS